MSDESNVAAAADQLRALGRDDLADQLENGSGVQLDPLPVRGVYRATHLFSPR